MQTDETIPVNEFCIHHKIELSFIHSLKDVGLIEVMQLDEKLCVPLSQLPQLEKLVRLYYEMDINLEGIETITYLLNRMHEMQQQIVKLTNRIQLYENEENEI
jgi:hypothetical protein